MYILPELTGSVVKISWSKNNNDWEPRLKLVDKDGYKEIPLKKEEYIEFEITNRKKCIGHHTDIGKMSPCPKKREIDSGSQCRECREKDVYTGYVEGRSPAKIKAEFTVYLAQAGRKIKVGVTRTGKITRRWVEQGADYAAPIKKDIDSKKALELEQKIYRENPEITQTIRKENKLKKTSCNLKKYQEKLSIDKKITDLQKKLGYPKTIGKKLKRKGRFSGQIKIVKGQIISNGDLCMAMMSGKEIKEPSQTTLKSYS